MSSTHEQFFTLLRSGLWNSPIDTDLFSGVVDWERIMKMAQMQTVGGVLFDGISNLPSAMHPPVELMRKLYQTVVRIEQSHQLLNLQLVRILSALQSNDIYPILLKGQGLAQNYPNPVRRQCGDIDLYVGKDNCQKAIEILLELGAQADEESNERSPKHKGFYLDNVSVELHFIVERLRNPIQNRRFQCWTELYLNRTNAIVWNLDNAEVLLPPVNFNALYIFSHLFLHFIQGGVGLRQLCDWVLFLHAFNEQINQQELMRDLKSLGLLRAWQMFGCLAVNKLGLPENEFPFYSTRYGKQSQKVLAQIFQSGNFGHFKEMGQHPSGYLAGKLHSLSIRNKWMFQIFRIFPKESSLFYIYYWTTGVINIFNRR